MDSTSSYLYIYQSLLGNTGGLFMILTCNSLVSHVLFAKLCWRGCGGAVWAGDAGGRGVKWPHAPVHRDLSAVTAHRRATAPRPAQPAMSHEHIAPTTTSTILRPSYNTRNHLAS